MKQPVFKITLCYLLFYFGMWASKTIHPLYWQSLGDLPLFSISYAIMAVAGAFSIFWSRIVTRLGTRHALMLGASLYTLGLLLRGVPPDIIIAAASGFIAGMGASISILAMKNWIFAFDEPDRPKTISMIVNAEKSAQLLGTFSAGWLVLLFNVTGSIPFSPALILVALFPLISLLFMPRFIKLDNPQKKGGMKSHTIRELIQHNPKFVIAILAALFLSGLYSAVLLPLIPIYLHDGGLSMSALSTIWVPRAS
ncbi:MAG: MFS transporter [Francisellaceae bacterium]